MRQLALYDRTFYWQEIFYRLIVSVHILLNMYYLHFYFVVLVSTIKIEVVNEEQAIVNIQAPWMDPYLHSAQPPNPVSGVVAIRMDRVNICSKGSTPSILPAAIALLLYAKQLSLCCLFSQYRQHQVPFGIADKPTHSARNRQYNGNENSMMWSC